MEVFEKLKKSLSANYTAVSGCDGLHDSKQPWKKDLSFFLGQLKTILDGFLNSRDGLLTGKQNSLEDDLAVIDEDRAKLEARISAQETRLKSQFAYNDAIIQTINTTLDYLTQQFEAMNNSKK